MPSQIDCHPRRGRETKIEARACTYFRLPSAHTRTTLVLKPGRRQTAEIADGKGTRKSEREKGIGRTVLSRE